MKINEIFLSIQGEGTRAGELCVFIRLAGCSFGCFYCDTKYAAAAKSAETKDYSVAELVEAAKSYGVGLVEITGGEPLEQEDCARLAEELLAAGFFVLIETNGAHDISVLPAAVVKIMDIKLPGASPRTDNERFRQKNLQHLSPQDEVKFVINDAADYDWAKNFLKSHQIPCKVIFSPCEGGVSATLLAEKIISDKIPVRLGLQIHKILWGNKRGV